MTKVKQTAGRDALGGFAPMFAALNDDVLFGEVWSDDALDLKTRSMLTVTTLVAKGMVDASFEYHLASAKQNGVTGPEMAAMLTHVAFYAGWPNAWAAFRMAVKVYGDEAAAAAGNGSANASAADGSDLSGSGDASVGADACDAEAHGGLFGLGAPNDAYAQYFTGRSYLNPLTDPAATQFVANVTFEPGCRNNWHVHHAEEGGGQVLLVTDGRGWYQEWGKPAQELRPGDCVTIPAGVKHWHGAAKDRWMSHVAFEACGTGLSNEWLEPVGDADYDALP